MEDQGRLVGNNRLGLVLPVSTPQRQPHKVVMVAGGQRRQPVQPVVDPFEVLDRNVVVEVRVVVPRCPRLLGCKIAPLLQSQGKERAGRNSLRMGHAQSFKKLEVLCTTAGKVASRTRPVDTPSHPNRQLKDRYDRKGLPGTIRAALVVLPAPAGSGVRE